MRAYLLTTVRRVAASWAKTARREQLVEDFAVFAVSAAGAPGDRDTVDLGADVRALHEAEQSMAVQAFRSLPERYQTVLWHTAVEDESPSEVAPLLGLTANATAVLAHRAREGLKQAYLQAHVSQSLTAGGDCARYADRLGAYARGGLRMRAERGCASIWTHVPVAGWPRWRSRTSTSGSGRCCRSRSSAGSPPGTPSRRRPRRWVSRVRVRRPVPVRRRVSRAVAGPVWRAAAVVPPRVRGWARR